MSQRKTVTKVRRLSLKELRENWPKTEDGAQAAALLQRHLATLMIDVALAFDCNPVTSQAEAASARTLARMIEDVRDLALPPPPPPSYVPTTTTLNRFKPADGQEPESQTEKK